MGRSRFTRAKRETFLQMLAATGNVSAAARAAGFDRSRLYVLRRELPDFAAAWRDAEEEAVDMLEAEARRRAVEGIEEPLVGGGKLIKDDDGRTVVVRKYNDRLLEFLLKAHRPEKYKERGDAGAFAGPPPSLRILVGGEGDGDG